MLSTIVMPMETLAAHDCLCSAAQMSSGDVLLEGVLRLWRPGGNGDNTRGAWATNMAIAHVFSAMYLGRFVSPDNSETTFTVS